MEIKRPLFLFLLVILIVSCEKESEEFREAEPFRYYLSDEGLLGKTPGPAGDWQYITCSINPMGPFNFSSWSTCLDRNIVRGQYGCDLIFWVPSECQVRIDIILKEGNKETVLATHDLTIPYYGEEGGLEFKRDAEVSPLLGTNPKGGKNDYLVLKITHIAGIDPVVVYFDGAVGWLGCTHITVFHDK